MDYEDKKVRLRLMLAMKTLKYSADKSGKSLFCKVDVLG